MLLLLLAIAIALVLLRPVRERLEPTATIKDPDDQALMQGAPPYDDAEMTRIQNLVPGLLDEYVALHKQANPTATTEQAQAHGRIRFARHVAYYYRDYYAPAIGSADPTKIDTSIANNNIFPERAPLFKRLLMAYFFPQGATGATGTTQTGTSTQTGATGATQTGATGTTQTGATGTSQTGATGTTQTGTTQTGGTGTAGGSIQVPNLSAPGVIPFYSDAELNRIQSLVPTAYSQLVSSFTTAGETPSNAATLARNSLATIIAQFYVAVYSSLTRPVQTSDIDAFLPTLPASVRPPPEVLPAIKELLTKYYMGTAASQGPSFQQPRSYAELDALYKTKLAEYQTKVTEALRTNDTSALPAIRTLNAEISQLLEEMLSSLDPLRQDTEATRRQREELVAVLAQIQREQSGLRDDKDSFGRVRRIREMQQGVKESDLKLYAVLFVSACLGVFIIAMSKS